MATLGTVADYLAAARVLLQDTTVPYRYSDDDLVSALNYSFLEVRRLRADLVLATLKTTPPSYSSASPTSTVAMDPQYRVALVYYMVGSVQLRDDEATQDPRAGAFLAKFQQQLTSMGV